MTTKCPCADDFLNFGEPAPDCSMCHGTGTVRNPDAQIGPVMNFSVRPGLRPGLPDLPERMRHLPLDARGYPVPWFVAWIDGVPDFRVIEKGKLCDAVRFRFCWICGGSLGSFGAFVLGPMCAVNRTNSEPPSHRECAVFAAKACPFLTLPKAQRREANLPTNRVPAPGIMLLRNPGAVVVWVTKKWQWFPVNNGVLCAVGNPTETLWFAEGRSAKRAEVEESIRTGIGALRSAAEMDGPAGVRELDSMIASAMKHLPAE